MSAGGHVYSTGHDVIGSSSDTVHTALIHSISSLSLEAPPEHHQNYVSQSLR